MKIFLLVLFSSVLILSAECQTKTTYSKEYHGLKLGRDSADNSCIFNSHNYRLSTVANLNLDTDLICQDIRNSELKDRELIERILLMYADKNQRLIELINLSLSYPEIGLIILKNAESALTKNYSNKELKQLKRKKP